MANKSKSNHQGRVVEETLVEAVTEEVTVGIGMVVEDTMTEAPGEILATDQKDVSTVERKAISPETAHNVTNPLNLARKPREYDRDRNDRDRNDRDRRDRGRDRDDDRGYKRRSRSRSGDKKRKHRRRSSSGSRSD
jgi:hypothetical protein